VWDPISCSGAWKASFTDARPLFFAPSTSRSATLPSTPMAHPPVSSMPEVVPTMRAC
jgi:hypothetical protein